MRVYPKHSTLLLFLVFANIAFAQVKIGDNPELIHANSILELESNNQALVLTRLTDLEMNAITPLKGALVYNTDFNCIYLFQGTTWESLCDSNTPVVTASNGLEKIIDDIQLGGTLIKATEINTDLTNTLAIIGLEEISPIDHKIVLSDDMTGELRKTSISSMTQKEEILIMANNGQTQFTTPLPITNTKKIDVFRNGIKVGFTTLNTSLIELENSIICYQNDQIRIVQFY